MAESAARMSPEFALAAAVETIPVLRGRVTSMQPRKDAAAPFAFYIPTADSEESALDGPAGLQHFSATLHIVAATFRHLQLLAAKVKQAVTDMRGEIYRTPAEDEAVGLKGSVLVECTEIEQSSPDLYEANVGYYRRMYAIRLDYQTIDVYEDEEVISG